MKMINQDRFFRDTWVEVNLDYIKSNVEQMRRYLPTEVELMAVVKANAYGHGDLVVAKTALESGAACLAVAFLDEALALRQKGIEAPILVLGATKPSYAHVAAKHNIALTVFQEEWIQEAQKLLSDELTVTVHVKIDTGMGRIGIREEETLTKIEAQLRGDARFDLEGVYTHFATADSKDLTYFYSQLERFKELVGVFQYTPRKIHASNSAASLREPKAYYNSIRYGIAMYGLSPSPEMKDAIPFPLLEAFSLRTKIIHVKKLLPGESISYGATYEASEEEWIGTLPIGYADGWIRKLQGKEVLVNGMRVPIVGRICMDQCMIKLPYEVKLGTMVTLIGTDGTAVIEMDEVASWLETINYEVPCLISNRVPRVYIKQGKEVMVNNPILHN